MKKATLEEMLATLSSEEEDLELLLIEGVSDCYLFSEEERRDYWQDMDMCALLNCPACHGTDPDCPLCDGWGAVQRGPTEQVLPAVRIVKCETPSTPSTWGPTMFVDSSRSTPDIGIKRKRS